MLSAGGDDAKGDNHAKPVGGESEALSASGANGYGAL